jgi:hypothetical protein
VSRRSFFERVDDWMNPIVVKELRQAVQSRLVVSALMLFLFIQIVVLGIRLLNVRAQAPGQIDYQAGRSLFLVLQGFMLGTCMLVPAYVGGRLGSERSDTNSDLMFISTLKPRAIVGGKFLSGVILVLLIFSAYTPFMTFTYLLRGIDIPTILFIVAMDFVLALWGIAGVIFLAVIPAPRAVKGAMGLASFFGLWGLFGMGMSFTEAMVNFGLFYEVGSWEFWRPVLLALAIIVGQCALFFTWSTAILSPPSANKAVLVRLVMLCYIILLGVPSCMLSKTLASYIPLGTWVIIAGVLASVQLFISVNERERLGPRVRRAIPRSPLPRALAFLFYSGGGGGVLFSSLLLLGIFLTGLLVLQFRGDLAGVMSAAPFGVSLSHSGWDSPLYMGTSLRIAILIGLYTYCFCMTGVFVRAVLLRGRMKASFTWLAILLLIGLGSAGPYLVQYFLGQEMYSRHIGRDVYWHMTNPILTIPFASGDSYFNTAGLFDMYCMPFLAVWAILVSVANLPWLVGHMKRFVPLRQKARPVAEPRLAPAESPVTS